MKKSSAQLVFLKQISTLASGTVLGQLILFATLPFLQKYFYGPAEFGVFTVFVSISELLISVSGLKYEYGVVLQKRHKNAVNLLVLSLLTVLLSASLTLLVYAFLFLVFPHISWVKDLGFMGFLLPLSVLSYGTVNALHYWFNREQNYAAMSGTKIVASISSEPAKFAFANQALNGLILGRVIGQMMALVFTCLLFYKRFAHMFRLISRKQMRKEAGLNKKYPLQIMPGAFITVLITAVYVQFFSHFFGKEQVGLLGVSVSYLGVAFGVISTAFGQVFYKKISLIDDGNELKRIFRNYAAILSVPALLAIIAVYLIPADWITSLLGNRWKDILPVTRIMVLWISVSFVSASLSFMHIRINNQKNLLRIEFLHLIAVFICLFACYSYSKSFVFTLYGFTIVQIIHYLTVISSAYYQLHKSVNS